MTYFDDETTRKRKAAALLLLMHLRGHLAYGDNYPSLSYNFRVASNTISLIINEVCDAIKTEFAAEVIQCPTTTEEWFEKRTYFDDETTRKKKAAALLLLMHLSEHDEQLLQAQHLLLQVNIVLFRTS
jgi:hypothetical protein